MKKRLNLLTVILIVLTTFSCSSDDNEEVQMDIDPIVGEWQLIRSVDFFDNTESEFLADDCSSQSREIFSSDGTYSFTLFSSPQNECENSFFSTSGSWLNQNGVYEIEFESNCLGDICEDDATPIIILVNDNTLRIQFNDDLENGELTSYFFREYQRL